ncbi:hypothetical protein P7C70_g9206, partial [Phenoliferia sp. Uapishka_3]
PSPLLIPPLLPPDSFLLVTIRDLTNDKWITLAAPKEWRIGRLKREAVERLRYASEVGEVDIPGEISEKGGMTPEKLERVLSELSEAGMGSGLGSPGKKAAKGRLGKKKSLGRKGLWLSGNRVSCQPSNPLDNSPSLTSPIWPSSPDVISPSGSSYPTFASFPLPSPPLLAPASASAFSSAFASTSVIPLSPKLPLHSPVLTMTGLPIDPEKIKASRRASVPSSVDAMGFSTAGEEKEREKSRISEGYERDSESDAVKKMRRERERRIDEEVAGLRFSSAIIGCYIQEDAVVGKKLVQFDLLTLQPAKMYFDRNISEYHLPFYKKEVSVVKPLAGIVNAKPDRKSAKWTKRVVEIDGVHDKIFVFKASEELTVSATFRLPLLSLSIFRESSADPQIIKLKFLDGKRLVMKPDSEVELRELVRVFGSGSAATREEFADYAKEEDEEWWRINGRSIVYSARIIAAYICGKAVRLAHASRHNRLTPPPPPPARPAYAPIPLTTSYSQYSVRPPIKIPRSTPSEPLTPPSSLSESSPLQLSSPSPNPNPNPRRPDRWSGSAITTQNHRPTDSGSGEYLIIPSRHRSHSNSEADGERTPRAEGKELRFSPSFIIERRKTDGDGAEEA